MLVEFISMLTMSKILFISNFSHFHSFYWLLTGSFFSLLSSFFYSIKMFDFLQKLRFSIIFEVFLIYTSCVWWVYVCVCWSGSIANNFHCHKSQESRRNYLISKEEKKLVQYIFPLVHQCWHLICWATIFPVSNK